MTLRPLACGRGLARGATTSSPPVDPPWMRQQNKPTDASTTTKQTSKYHIWRVFRDACFMKLSSDEDKKKSSYHPKRRLLHPSVYRRLVSRSSLGPHTTLLFVFLYFSVLARGRGFSLMGDATRCFHKPFLLSRLLFGRESESRLLEVSKTSIPLPVWSLRLSSARAKAHTLAHSSNTRKIAGNLQADL